MKGGLNESSKIYWSIPIGSPQFVNCFAVSDVDYVYSNSSDLIGCRVSTYGSVSSPNDCLASSVYFRSEGCHRQNERRDS